jgi:class 3 adenylate cyclase
VNQDSPAADFWRYANGVKFSAAVSAIERFNTREPVAQALANLFATIGNELSVLIGAERTFHFFSNPDLRQIHLLDCDSHSTHLECSQPIEFRHLLDPIDKLSWSFYPSSERSTRAQSQVLPDTLLREFGSPFRVALAPFCRSDTPFGYFAFCWQSEQAPDVFGDSPEGIRLREAATCILDYLHTLVIKLILNHFPIHRDTYIPSFQRSGKESVCILFADIRNFTSAFETSRFISQDGQKYPQLLIGFIKAYLEAASLIIAEPGIGRIDKFIGDGIMATFGEYVVAPKDRDSAACLLGLYSASMLLDAFAKLHALFLKHPAFTEFLRQYNDVVSLRLGVGINFGEVVFDYFGSAAEIGSHSNLLGGYGEYTAVGDNVNAAQRLEGLASKPVAQVALLERGREREERSRVLIAPIVLSRTAFLRIPEALRPLGRDDDQSWEDSYRSSFALKGKGSVTQAYELFEDEINGDALIRRLRELVGTRLSDKVASCWKATRFQFDEADAKRLASRYFPTKSDPDKE